MQIINRNIKKINIRVPKIKWYSILNDEIRFYVDESRKNSSSEFINVIDWRSSEGLLNVDSDDYAQHYNKLNETYQNLTGRIFIKSDFGSTYNEYFLNTWSATPNGVMVIMK